MDGNERLPRRVFLKLVEQGLKVGGSVTVMPNLAEQFVFFLESPLLEKVDHTLCEVFEGYVRIHKNQNT